MSGLIIPKVVILWFPEDPAAAFSLGFDQLIYQDMSLYFASTTQISLVRAEYLVIYSALSGSKHLVRAEYKSPIYLKLPVGFAINYG